MVMINTDMKKDSQTFFKHLCEKVEQCDSPQWVEHCLAVGPAAQHRLVLNRRQVGSLLQRCEEAGDWDHQPGGLQPAGGPEVPAESHPVPVLVLLDELLVGRHGGASTEKEPTDHSESSLTPKEEVFVKAS